MERIVEGWRNKSGMDSPRGGYRRASVNLRRSQRAQTFGYLLAVAREHFEKVNGSPGRVNNEAIVREVKGHSRRTARYAMRLAALVCKEPQFMDECAGLDLAAFELAALFHDIGKSEIPVAILGKPGALDADEYALIKTHTRCGGRLIADAQLTDFRSVDQRCLFEVALCHHEHWDGGGYPFGLTGQQIPFCARLVAIADTYDALVHRRVYRCGRDHRDAVRVIERARGTQFDPRLTDLFASNAGILEPLLAA